MKPFVEGSKNDAVDAEAIFEAGMRLILPNGRHCSTIHAACSPNTASCGPQGPWRFMAQAPIALAGADLSHLARAIFAELLDQLDDLDRRIKAQITAIGR